MFKRVMTILISALAVVFVVLLLDRLPHGQPGPLPDVIPLSEDDRNASPGATTPVGDNVAIGDGRINILGYEPKPSERLKHIIKAEIYPQADSDTLRLVRPRISFFSKKGSETRITAPRGWIDTGGEVVTSSVESIRKGALQGGVIIRDDRGTPDYQGDDLVVLMDHCLYEQATYEGQPVHKFHTDAQVTVRAPEAELDALGMELYLNKTEDKNNNQIREVRLLKQVHVTMYEAGDKLKLDLTPTAPESPTPPAPSASPGSPNASSPSNAPAPPAAPSTTAAGPNKTPYKFTLVGDVTVVKGDQSLDADQKVELVAWMRDTLGDDKDKNKDKNKTDRTPPGGTQQTPTAGGSQPVPPASAGDVARPSRRVDKAGEPIVPVVVDCHGPLIYSPVSPKDAPADFHIDAVGRKVVLHDRKAQARAEGDHLRFDAASGQGYLSDDRQVVADLQNGKVKIVSRRMDFTATDTRQSVAFSGPGNLVAKVSGQGLGLGRRQEDSNEPFVATWQKSMTIAFGKYPQLDAAGQPELDKDGKPKEKDYARHAEFDGQAQLRRGAPSLSGEHIEIDLFPPQPQAPKDVAAAEADADEEPAEEEEQLKQAILRLVARGNVAVHQPTEGENMTVGDMTCGDLQVDFREEPGGKSRPKYLTARRQVVADHGKGYVRAEDLQAWLAPDPADPTQDRVVQMIADGNVYMQQVDDKQGTVLYAEGGHMEFKEHPAEVALGPDGKPAKARAEMLLKGTAAKPAMALQGPHRITGPQIYMNQVTGKAEVRGPGTLRLLSDAGMDGQKLDEPMPLNIAWTDSMLVLPGKDSTEALKKFEAHFQGQVRVRTPDSGLDSDDLWAFFDEAPRDESKPKPAGKPGETSLFGAGRATPTRMVAAGRVVARATDIPKETDKPVIVTTIWGPTLEYQFGKKVADPRGKLRAQGAAVVDGAGKMHILEVDHTPTNVLPKDRTPKSATTITWKKKMAFNQEQDQVFFGDQVVVEVLGQPSAGTGGFASSGKSTLWCQALWVYLQEGAEPSDPASRGNMTLKELVATSGPALPWVTTSAPVYFRDGDYVGQADRMSYEKAPDLLTLTGRPARIEKRSETDPQKFAGLILKYQLKKKLVEVIQPWTLEGRPSAIDLKK